MLNQDRIKTMAELTRYETGPDSDYLKINHMYRSDYIGMALLKNFVCVTVGYAILLALGCIYHFEFLTAKWFTLDLMAVAMDLIKWYLILIVVYSVIVYLVSSYRYGKMKKYIRAYDAQLAHLEELYSQNGKKNEPHQNDRRREG